MGGGKAMKQEVRLIY